MLLELRRVEVVPGRLERALDRFGTIARIFAREGARLLGPYTSVVGPSHAAILYALEFRDAAHFEKAWESFESDAEWQALKERTETDGPLVARVESSLWRAARGAT